MNNSSAISPSSANLSSFLSTSVGAALRPEVIEKTKHHVVDTFAAMISGALLDVGTEALRAVPSFVGATEANVLCAGTSLPAFAAAMFNAMLAHADETDDSHEMSKFHPGCAIVPTALAVAQRDRRSGLELLAGVAGGYDVGARVLEALGPLDLFRRGHATHALGSLFGAGATASIMMRFDADAAGRLFSYLAQEASGLTCWMEDHDHVQKAYVFGAMATKNALIAATLTQCGWTGVAESLIGKNRLFQVLGQAEGGRSLEVPFVLGDEILRSNIKKWCVGSPIQAALDALETLTHDFHIDAANIAHVTIELPAFEAVVVDNRDMPNINLQYLSAVYLTEGQLTFEAAHDLVRFNDPGLRALRDRITLVASEALQKEGGRQAIVTIVDVSGQVRQHRTRHVRGTWGNPMPRQEVDDKARELIAPVLGTQVTADLLEALWVLETLSAEQLDRLVRSIVQVR